MLEKHEAESVVTVALLAALADGRSDAAEREQLRSLLDTLARDTELPSLASIHQSVVLKQTDLPSAIARLEREEAKRMAFEIAVCVADADGKVTPQEQAFLDNLERALNLDHEAAVAFEQEAESIALADPAADRADPQELLAPDVARAPEPQAVQTDAIGREVDGVVLRYAILNGALELLPQNLATMAILPLQTRMVYTIGRRYGHALGMGHIKEFIATLGIGATSQMLENFARKALGKFVKQTLGKTAGKVAKAATGPMMTFATTYAIGKVAKAYYAGGRTLSAIDLRAMFQQDLAQGKMLYDQHRPQIESSAQSIDVTKVLNMVRGGAPV